MDSDEVSVTSSMEAEADLVTLRSPAVVSCLQEAALLRRAHEEALVDALAANSHCVWALTRLSQGWSYAAQRDNDAKRHPLLLPYGQLDAAARRGNRDPAAESMRLVATLGFELVAPEVDRESELAARVLHRSSARGNAWYYQCYSPRASLLEAG